MALDPAAAALSPWPARPTTAEGDLNAAPVALSTIRTLASGSVYAVRNIGTVDLTVIESGTAPDPAAGGRTVQPGEFFYLKADGAAWAWGAGARVEISLAAWWRACVRVIEMCGGARFAGIKFATDATYADADALGSLASARVEKDAPGAPQAVKDEAVIRYVGYLAAAGGRGVGGAGFGGGMVKETVGPISAEPVTNHAAAFRLSGAYGLLAPWKVRRAGVIG